MIGIKIDFDQFTEIICNKIDRGGGESHAIMINGGVVAFYLSENGDGVICSNYRI